ncbi:MAG: ATP-binding protein [Selenomonadaceae bacterium]|nr:ATP-binding protein [Selenomonadaceae bacterium]MBR2734440.1 ATP-binding protein [Selenomonadaceae bacterium]
MHEWVDNPASIDPTFSTLPLSEQQSILAFFKQARDDSTTTPNTTDFKSAATILRLPTQRREDTTPEELRTLAESIIANPNRLKTLRENYRDELERCRKCDNPAICPKGLHRWETPKCMNAQQSEWEYVPCVFAKRSLNNKFRSSRIPARYLGKTFADYEVDKLNQAAVEFAKTALESPIGAYFFGECGTGKTFLAALIAQEFLQNGKSVIFIKVPSLLDDIKATFNGNGTELDLLDELRAANLVVLDDFGMEKSTQWAGSELCKILDMRYDNPTGKTIITSNLSPKELAEHLNNASDGANLNGSRIADRLREICKPVLLRGTTRRN